jgi:hypothetical protein
MKGGALPPTYRTTVSIARSEGSVPQRSGLVASTPPQCDGGGFERG